MPSQECAICSSGPLPLLWADVSAMRQLLRSAFYATDMNCSPWEYAVDADSLLANGLSRSDIRWLIVKGYLRHGRDHSLPEDQVRVVRHTSSLTVSRQSCFILSHVGQGFAQEICDRIRRSVSHVRPLGGQNIAELRPIWDLGQRELRLDQQVVKQFRVPASNQITVLSAFEEEDWSECIDDPLPPATGIDSKRRLHATINRLNHNQKHRLIHFGGNGTGDGVRWELIQHAASGEGGATLRQSESATGIGAMSGNEAR